MKDIGLYIHVPFCKSKCPYCDFYSIRSDVCGYDDYAMCVIESLEYWSDKMNRKADTLYFGGGTPSVIGAENIAMITRRAKNLFKVNGEITVECNPSAIEDGFFDIIAEAGVNRVSIGMQSAVDSERRILGRLSDSSTVKTRIKQAKSAGINNISLDVMLGVPRQTQQSLEKTAEFLIENNIQHVSAYMLKLEKGTYYYNNQSKLNLPDDDEVADMYLLLGKLMSDAGFEHYEISNYAKPGFESKHNLKYWNCEEYLGIGPSAHSFIDGRRFYYPRDIDLFKNANNPIDDGIGGNADEYVMLALRLKSGLDIEKLKSKYNIKIKDEFIEKCKFYEKNGFVNISGDAVSLTEKGFLMSNTIIAELENEL